MYGLRNSELSTCLFQFSHKTRQTILLYAYFTPKVDFKRKFNHHQSFLYEWRLTARNIRKFRIGQSIRIESRIGRTIRNRINHELFFVCSALYGTSPMDINNYCVSSPNGVILFSYSRGPHDVTGLGPRRSVHKWQYVKSAAVECWCSEGGKVTVAITSNWPRKRPRDVSGRSYGLRVYVRARGPLVGGSWHASLYFLSCCHRSWCSQ